VAWRLQATSRMDDESRPLICGVCGREIRADEPAVQREDAVLAHVSCVSSDARARKQGRLSPAAQSK